MVFVKYAVFTDLGIVYVLSIAVTSAMSELDFSFKKKKKVYFGHNFLWMVLARS